MSAVENPPAFPSIETHPGWDMPMHHFGMSLRDYFAGQALAGILANPETNARPEEIPLLPGLCFELADAMLAARGAS